MNEHSIGTRQEWLKARIELLKTEKELTQKSDAIAKQRQELTWVRVDKNYAFDTEAGSQSLAELFAGRSQLIVYHFMFGPDYTAGSLLAPRSPTASTVWPFTWRTTTSR